MGFFGFAANVVTGGAFSPALDAISGGGSSSGIASLIGGSALRSNESDFQPSTANSAPPTGEGAPSREELAAIDTADLDPENDPAHAQELARRSAPILVLPAGSNDDLPADPLEFIDNSRLRENRSSADSIFSGRFLFGDIGQDRQLGNNEDGRGEFGPEDIANLGGDHFLDLDNDVRDELGRSTDDPAPLHYQYDYSDPTSPKLTYHVFYAYQDGPARINHEGDWERVTLTLDPATNEPVAATYSAHTDAETHPIEDVADPRTGRPVVYVSEGTHANYATEGRQSRLPFLLGIADDVGVRNPDGLPIRELEGAVVYENWGEARPVQAQSWYSGENEGVKWGEIGELSDTSGPRGPSIEKGGV